MKMNYVNYYLKVEIGLYYFCKKITKCCLKIYFFKSASKIDLVIKKWKVNYVNYYLKVKS